MTPRWKRRPEGSNWGDFGADDQLGRLNLLTPEMVLRGIAEVKLGRTFCLSLPLDYPGGNVGNPRRHPPRLFAATAGGKYFYNRAGSLDDPALTSVTSDDAVLLHTQYSTQWDSFAHAGGEFDADGDGIPEIVYYNGWRAQEHVVLPEPRDTDDPLMRYEGVQAKALGIERMAETCVQGRGVMIDLHAHFGREHRFVSYDDLMRVMEVDKVEVEAGDLVCLHTGFDAVIFEMDKHPDHKRMHLTCCGLNGRDKRLLQWITDSNLVALISDNRAVEIIPALPGEGRYSRSPLHEHCLFKLGVHLGEMFLLGDLARWLRANGRNRFLLTAPPLRLPGAVGSPATPVATV
ncbi:MAG: cyclase family protein [Alphaproteobacteria bacterium]